jgi:hypothetical protein
VDVKRARNGGGGVGVLRRRPAPGARPRLSEQQRANKAPELLERGAGSRLSGRGMDLREGGYGDPRRVRGELPPGSRVSRLLEAPRQSLQKPPRQASQREEETIEHWKERRGLPSKKGAKVRQDHSVVRPIGLLPVAHDGSHLRSGGKDAHPRGGPHARSPLKAMTAITLDGKLFYMMEQKSRNAPSRERTRYAC